MPRLLKILLIRTQKRPYFLAILGITITACAILAYFVFEEYYIKYSKLQSKMAFDTERIEHSFSDIIKHTEFVMKVIISQIKHNPKDLDYVENVINKYSVNPHLNNVLSWTRFSWIDGSGIKRIDSTQGKTFKEINMSGLGYIDEAKEVPGRIRIGVPTFSKDTQRYILPASIGAINNKGEYIGALTIGFDLKDLGLQLGEIIKDPNTSFALINNKTDIISQFSNVSNNEQNFISNRRLHKFIARNNIIFNKLDSFSEINLLVRSNSVYIKKIPHYPFAIYLKYHNDYFKKSLYKDILYRVIEVLILALVSLAIILAIYKREKSLREKAEHSKSVAVQALKSKNDFLAYTAHELRSPISFMISSSEIMLNQLFGPLPQKYLEYIKNMNQSGKELLTFIEDLLDTMKLQKGHFTINESLVDVRALILRAIKINNINYDERIIIETDFHKMLPQVISDEKRLLQIFNNIISNSIKYSPADSILKIEALVHKDELFINFYDNGYGMSEDGLQKSFNEFEVAHDISFDSLNMKSVGLGLPLIKSLLELMKLRFFIDSKLGAGTTVTIVFPKNKLKRNK